jgi:hypothetical protein
LTTEPTLLALNPKKYLFIDMVVYRKFFRNLCYGQSCLTEFDSSIPAATDVNGISADESSRFRVEDTWKYKK